MMQCMKRAALSRRLIFALATSEEWERAVRVLPAGERAAYSLASRYVAGTTRADAIACARRLADAGLAASIDLFGESVSNAIQADEVMAAYVELAGDLSRAARDTYLSLDLSHLGLDEPGHAARRRLERIAAALPDGRCVQVGAEEARRADAILAAVLAVAEAGKPVSATLQANLKRSRADAQLLAEAGVPVRLVKGAYVEDPDVALPWGEETDLAFVELAHELHRGGAKLTLGTHDAVLREALVRALPDAGVEMLLGVREDDALALARRGVPVRIYVPYGDDWFRYAMRRWAEARGA
jgi:proline dehydrogenase